MLIFKRLIICCWNDLLTQEILLLSVEHMLIGWFNKVLFVNSVLCFLNGILQCFQGAFQLGLWALDLKVNQIQLCDILSDFIIYAAIPISLVVSSPTIERYFCLTLMISTFYVNAASWMYLSAILEKQKQGSKTSREDTTVIMPTGLVGGTETVLMYSFFFMMPERIAILFSIMSILVGLTICQRLIWATVKLWGNIQLGR